MFRLSIYIKDKKRVSEKTNYGSFESVPFVLQVVFFLFFFMTRQTLAVAQRTRGPSTRAALCKKKKKKQFDSAEQLTDKYFEKKQKPTRPRKQKKRAYRRVECGSSLSSPTITTWARDRRRFQRPGRSVPSGSTALNFRGPREPPGSRAPRDAQPCDVA